MNKIKSTNSGFTIIEVVLVLAIAGVIFLIVFLAVPQLRVGRQDAQRRNDAARMLAVFENFRTNTGSYPVRANVQGQLDAGNYLEDTEFVNPDSGLPYTFLGVSGTGLTNVVDETVVVKAGASCDGNQFSNEGSYVPSSTIIAVMLELDRDGDFYCVDNS